MAVLHLLSCAFGGAFAANAVPHLVAGMQGRAFQSPFAKPSGIGLSPPATNVLWAFANMAVAWLLLFRVGIVDLRSGADVLAAAVGALALSLFAARHFGRLHGGEPGD